MFSPFSGMFRHAMSTNTGIFKNTTNKHIFPAILFALKFEGAVPCLSSRPKSAGNNWYRGRMGSLCRSIAVSTRCEPIQVFFVCLFIFAVVVLNNPQLSSINSQTIFSFFSIFCDAP